jgi:arginine-tRNA-protein transferase
MTPFLYEGFVYRGWRRSGIHLYKPCNFDSCCPTLTIRLPAAQFVATKSQKKLLRKMETLLSGTTTTGGPPKQQQQQQNQNAVDKMPSAIELQHSVEKSGILDVLEQITKRAIHNCLPSDVVTIIQEQEQEQSWKYQYRLHKPSKRDLKQSQIQVTTHACAQISGKCNMLSRDELVTSVFTAIKNDSQFQSLRNDDNDVSIVHVESHPPSGQIKCIIQLHDQLMMKSNSSDYNGIVSSTSNGNVDDDKLGKWYKRTTGKNIESDQRCITVTTMTSHQSALDPNVHRLYTYYQNVVHNDPDPFVGESKQKTATNINDGESKSNQSNASNEDPQRENRETEEEEDGLPTNPADLDWGNAPTYYKDRIVSMLNEYLQSIPQKKHRDLVLENYYSFYQFLVEAPFPFSQQQQQPTQHPRRSDDDISWSSSTIDCGVYHQHYRLGDVLLAVGVVDILPNGLSSVYLFYHPTFSHELVALGKYAILKEIEFARDNLKVPYYYLGYYIESCQKMRYKSEYKPSQLLCPKYYQWVDAAEAVLKLQQTPHNVCPLIDVVGGSDNDTSNNSNVLGLIEMDIGAGIPVTIDMLQPNGVEVVKPILEEFITEAGQNLSTRCLVKLS